MAVGVFTDQASKWLVLNVVMVPPRTIDVTPFFNVTLGFNSGVSFGMLGELFRDRPILLALIALAIVAGLTVWALRAKLPLESFALGLIAGGAIGNVVDRIRQGSVTDFLDFHIGGWHWPAFNLADVAITAGAACLLVVALFPQQPADEAPSQTGH